tara:strand:+ start:330 stop:461 length:132 start_codon:yes stop_codon:yes gene_type:complete
MIKNFILALMLCCIIISCGKKNDPEYKETKTNKNMQLLASTKA